MAFVESLFLVEDLSAEACGTLLLDRDNIIFSQEYVICFAMELSMATITEAFRGGAMIHPSWKGNAL